MTLWSKVEKNETCNGVTDKRFVSQDPKLNYIFFDSISKQLPKNIIIINFQLLNQKLSP